MMGGVPPPFLGSLPYLQKIWMGVYRDILTFENTRPFSWEVEIGLDLGFENFLEILEESGLTDDECEEIQEIIFGGVDDEYVRGVV